jgi:hypothetical protein
MINICNGICFLFCRDQDGWLIHYQSFNVSSNTIIISSQPCCDSLVYIHNLSAIYLFCRLVLGYAYPAYDCYKTVELNRPEIEQLRFWCQYWYVLVALSFGLDYHSWFICTWSQMHEHGFAGFYLQCLLSSRELGIISYHGNVNFWI